MDGYFFVGGKSKNKQITYDNCFCYLRAEKGKRFLKIVTHVMMMEYANVKKNM